MNYGYARVSTNHQKEDRQIASLKMQGLNDDQIFIDKQTGKNFCRSEWKKLCRKIKPGDLLFIHSIDRLGRNMDETRDVWDWLTKKKKIDICVINFPLLDTRDKKECTGKLIADIALSVLCFQAEQELINTRERIIGGIEARKEKGLPTGRKRKVSPEDFASAYTSVLNGSKTAKEVASDLHISLDTYYEYRKYYEANIN